MTNHARKDLPASILQIRTVTAVHHVRRMRGGAQSQLMYCSDGGFYVVKFTNNPQHLRVLANEMLASLLARHLGLPVAEGVIVEVDASFVRGTPEMTIQLQSTTVPCQSGLQFGSRYVVDPFRDTVFDYLPPNFLGHVQNRRKFWGVLAFDKWTCNADQRQAAFWKGPCERHYKAAFIDQGYCFNGGKWSLLDNILTGVYAQNEIYAGVNDWDSFEPALSGIETITKDMVHCAARAIPSAWYGGDWRALQHLALLLHERRQEVRGAINAFRLSAREPFPNWEKNKTICRTASAS
jgi:hypothetical protein